jgi:protein SCO1/2
VLKHTLHHEETMWRKVSPRERIRERYFPNVGLLTHEGRRVRFYDDLLKDKFVIINFMYACCTNICPIIMANLAKVKQELGPSVGRDIFMYSITLRPEQDSWEVLKKHAESLQIGTGWLLLTGQAKDIELLRRKLGFTDPDPEIDRDVANHSGIVRYGSEPRMHWGACPGEADPRWLARVIRSVARLGAERVQITED